MVFSHYSKLDFFMQLSYQILPKTYWYLMMFISYNQIPENSKCYIIIYFVSVVLFNFYIQAYIIYSYIAIFLAK